MDQGRGRFLTPMISEGRNMGPYGVNMGTFPINSLFFNIFLFYFIDSVG